MSQADLGIRANRRDIRIIRRTPQAFLLSVLIIDDSILIRMGLKQLIQEEYRSTIFGEAKSGAEAFVLLSKQQWDLVLLDISLPDQDPFSVLQRIRSFPLTDQCRVLMLGMHEDVVSAGRALQFGADGYVSKSSSRNDLLQAIRDACLGKKAFDRALLQPGAGPADARAILSSREYEVMLALAHGKRIGEIAAEFDLSNRTISTFKRRILNKLHLNSIADLVRYALNHKLA
jgi:DNA-binding NarL/FixJ family response regulator